MFLITFPLFSQRMSCGAWDEHVVAPATPIRVTSHFTSCPHLYATSHPYREKTSKHTTNSLASAVFLSLTLVAIGEA